MEVWEIETDLGHVEIILPILGQTKQSNAVTTPRVRHTDDQIERRLREAQHFAGVDDAIQIMRSASNFFHKIVQT